VANRAALLGQFKFLCDSQFNQSDLLPDFTVSVWINYTAGAGTEGPRIISTSGYEITTDATFVTERHINFNNTLAPGSGFTNVSSSNGIPPGVGLT